MVSENINPKNNTYRYRAHGLEISSQLAIPELLPGNSLVAAQVFITLGTVPEKLEQATFSGVRFQASPGIFLLKVDHVARFLIRDGKYIDIEPDKGANESDIRLFLLGSALGALFHQQGLLPLHGSAIVYKGKAIAFSGISGTGKSTLAASFLKKGYTLLSDDICTISLNESGIPTLYPSYPQMKLWADSLEKLGEEKTPLKKVREGIMKYSMPLPQNFHDNPVPLAGLYIISVKNTQGITLEPVKGIEKFNMLKNNTYRLNFIKGTGTTASHFTHIEAMARHCFRKAGRKAFERFSPE